MPRVTVIAEVATVWEADDDRIPRDVEREALELILQYMHGPLRDDYKRKPGGRSDGWAGPFVTNILVTEVPDV